MNNISQKQWADDLSGFFADDWLNEWLYDCVLIKSVSILDGVFWWVLKWRDWRMDGDG